MPLEYAYHPGNVAHSSAPEVADTVVPAAKSFGINLIPITLFILYKLIFVSTRGYI